MGFDSLKLSDKAVIPNIDGEDTIWISKSKVESASRGAIDVPKNNFPFTRLARATTLDSQTTYLYHQMNETTFAEESFDASMGEWGEPTYINVAPPP